ncbi:FERM and PDZ domain-containing protein 1 [Lampris incognitus]|uniref:FERM and PDZ domain-containing protein 1 n=1 Tax=Lampris incognitus TaxID=2546036 RepID=UPI0024B59BAE|nr:FERM and PDZ domain-containing protein 1 [Lampris incognitus]
MEEQDRSRSPSRRTSRVEQVVGRWLRRSRDLGSRSHSLSRERVLVDWKAGDASCSDQRNYPFRFTVQIQRDPSLSSHGLTLSQQTPILVQDVIAGGPAEGRLVPGDQLVKINNVAVEDLTPEQAAEIIRECQDTLTMTVLRTMMGPKSSFITPEKRAKLKTNPVKVRFAEEVEVNGHSQGNSLLFLPNVLKVYLENGQTKAFKFEPNTTVKDIVMTLKEKLSLSRIEHFSLVLEQQYSITKLLLLQDEERIQQVVQKREAHDYRCLFRVCFMPKDPKDLLLDDPTAFEYLYLQGVNDVLQERFAVEMRCNTALRLAALHIQERLASCGQSSKTNLKIITKTWGIENFVSSTLLRNMREKDLRKAINYHMKKNQSQQDPKQKGLSVNQARINYLEELCDLKSFGGKSFSATMMLQDRESMVTLLVGARYGVSQLVNHKLSIMTTLTEFNSITRIELLPESDRISLVKIYLQDIKPITLLLESVAAKDMSCLIAGYCRVFVDPNLNIFPWTEDSKKHKVSAEEGYVSRCDSDSDASSDLDMDPLVTAISHDDKPQPRIRSSSDPDGRKRKDRGKGRERDGQEKGVRPWRIIKTKEENDTDTKKGTFLKNGKKDKEEDTEGNEKEDAKSGAKKETARHSGDIQMEITDDSEGEGEQKEGTRGKGGGEDQQVGGEEEQPSVSETSDSCRTDSRFLTSQSSDSLDALEEDDLISCSSFLIHPRPSPHPLVSSPQQLHPYPKTHPHPHLLAPPPAHSHPLIHHTVQPPTHDRLGHRGDRRGEGDRREEDGADLYLLPSVSIHGALFDHVEKPSINPCSDESFLCFAELSRLVDYLPSPPEASEDEEEEESSLVQHNLLTPTPSSPSSHTEFVFNFEESDAQCYYKLCPNVTPDSAWSLTHPLSHPVGEEEQAAKSVGEVIKAVDMEPVPILQPPPGFGDSSSDEEFFDARDRFASPEDPTSGAVRREAEGGGGGEEGEKAREEEAGGGRETLHQLRRRSRKRRSFMETNFTSTVSFPEQDVNSNQDHISNRIQKNLLTKGPTVFSLTYSEAEPAQLESKPIPSKSCSHGPGSPDQDGEPRAPSRTKKQEMEMEPDTMESKSVTDLVKTASPSIIVVRCRVEPDGKESADRRGDGKEEEEGEEKIEERKGNGEKDGEKEELTGVTGNGLLITHMLSEIIEEEEKGDETGENEMSRGEAVKGDSPSSGRPLIDDERWTELNASPTCLMDLDAKEGNAFLRPTLSFTDQNSYGNDYIYDEGVSDDLKPPSYAPPPPPPTSPLPSLPVVYKTPNNYSEWAEGGSIDMETSTKMSSSTLSDGLEVHSHEQLISKHHYINKEKIDFNVKPSATEDEVCSIVSSATTNSDDVTGSINSDNVFEDDDSSSSLYPSFCDNRIPESSVFTTATNRFVASANIVGKVEAPASILFPLTTNTEPHTSLHSVKSSRPLTSDHASTINSITAKLGAATTITSPTFNAGTQMRIEGTREIVSCTSQKIHKTRGDSTKLPTIETKGNVSSPRVSLTNTDVATNHDLSKEPSSPTHFLFQACSPSILGRLSASTLRGKIQRLPMYLSRSQEFINEAGVENIAQGPTLDSRDDPEITMKITDIDDVTKTMEDITTIEATESDDSDTTITESEVDSEVVMETSSGQITSNTVSEVKEVVERVLMVYESSPLPIRTEPKPEPRTHFLSPGTITELPGPITEPPISTMSTLDFQIDTSHLKIDISGVITEFPRANMDIALPSLSPPMVVTTQNLNGPGLAFHNQSEKLKRTSSDRPLVGLCRPAGEKPVSLKTISSDCGMFTFCEKTSHTKTTANLSFTPPPKPDFGCSSVLASGCESVVEGLQMPLDACGCPVVYANCFSGGDSFDDELTVYEFSCRTQSSGGTQTSGLGLPLMTTPPIPSFLSTSPPSFSSSSHSPSFPRSDLVTSSASELSPLLSPLANAAECFLSQTHKDTISRLQQQCYPAPPAGFQTLRGDVDELLSILEGSGADRSLGGRGGHHSRDTCPAHFTENKRVLNIGARRLMAGCQKVVGVGQSPDEMLLSLADSFRTLVELAGVCLWFSGCDRCDRRNADAVAGLADVARSFRDFCLAAERASSKRSCQDLSIKLLAKQCTALTASVFCLTQLFRTLTAL